MNHLMMKDLLVTFVERNGSNYEKLHYHGKNRENFSYENGSPKSNNKYVDGCPI